MASPAAVVKGSRVGLAYIPAGAAQEYFTERKIGSIADMERDWAEDYSDGETATHEIPGTAIDELRVFETTVKPADADRILGQFVRFLDSANITNSDELVYIVEPVVEDAGEPVKKRKVRGQ